MGTHNNRKQGQNSQPLMFTEYPVTRTPALYEKAKLFEGMAPPERNKEIRIFADGIDPFVQFRFENRHTREGRLVSSLKFNLVPSIRAEADDLTAIDEHLANWKDEAHGLDPKLFAFASGGWFCKGQPYPLVDEKGQFWRPPFYWLADESVGQESDYRAKGKPRTWLSLTEYSLMFHPEHQGKVRENWHRGVNRTEAQAMLPGRTLQSFSTSGNEQKSDLVICYLPRVEYIEKLGAFLVNSEDKHRCFFAVFTNWRLHKAAHLLNASEVAMRTKPLYGGDGNYYHVEREIRPERLLVGNITPATLAGKVGAPIDVVATAVPETPAASAPLKASIGELQPEATNGAAKREKRKPRSSPSQEKRNRQAATKSNGTGTHSEPEAPAADEVSADAQAN